MKSTLPYFALFYAIGIVIFGLFVRFWLRKKRLKDEEKKRGIQHRVLLFLLVSQSLLWSMDDLDRLRQDHKNGDLSFDELMVQQIARLTQPAPEASRYFTDEPVKCGTHVVKTLAEKHSLLSPSSIAELSSMGVDFSRAIPALYRPSIQDRYYETDVFRFHYTTQGYNAVDPEDGDIDGLPDYVNMMADVFTEVWTFEIDSLGYTRPPGDGWYEEDNGGNGLYDIYIQAAELGANVYGFTQPEYLASDGSGDNEYSRDIIEENAFTSYMVMRNNYDGFPYPERQSIQVTAAHEFFHSIQFGYDGWEKTWLLEATATWMEDEAYDDINDNYQYLKEWFEEPELALDYDSGPHWYGSWIFFRYLSEHLGGRATVRKILETGIKHKSGPDNDLSILTLDETLRRLGSSFREALNSMVIANQVLSSDFGVGDFSYEEADDYRNFGIESTYRESITLFDVEQQFRHDTGVLMHNASHYFKVTAGEGPLGPFEVRFSPDDGASVYQVTGILQRGPGSLFTYDVGTNFIIDDPPDAGSVVIAVVTDTSRDRDYHYSLEFQPGIPIPTELTLYQNYPNPFNETTTFRFFLQDVESVSLSIFNLLGNEVANVALPDARQGFNNAQFEARTLPSAIYIARLKTGSETSSRKITLIK